MCIIEDRQGRRKIDVMIERNCRWGAKKLWKHNRVLSAGDNQFNLDNVEIPRYLQRVLPLNVTFEIAQLNGEKITIITVTEA